MTKAEELDPVTKSDKVAGANSVGGGADDRQFLCLPPPLAVRLQICFLI